MPAQGPFGSAPARSRRGPANPLAAHSGLRRPAILPGLRRPAMLLAVLVAGAGRAVAPATIGAPPPVIASQPAPASSMCPGATVAAFGPDVCVFNDTMSQATIQADLNSIANQQVPVASQFDSQRYAVLFQPG